MQLQRLEFNLENICVPEPGLSVVKGKGTGMAYISLPSPNFTARKSDFHRPFPLETERMCQ